MTTSPEATWATPGALVPTEQMLCTATGTAAIGQYDNVGSVTATAASGGTVSDSNPSHYFGATTAVVLEKLVDGVDADTAPGPEIPEGAPVTWTYNVTNTGNVAIKSPTIVDDQGVTPTFVGGDTNANTDIDPGETWTVRGDRDRRPRAVHQRRHASAGSTARRCGHRDRRGELLRDRG